MTFLHEHHHYWSVIFTDPHGKFLIPEIPDVTVLPLSRETAFAGVQLRLCCTHATALVWAGLIPMAEDVILKRHDGLAVVERWVIMRSIVSGLDMDMINMFPFSNSCPFGEFLYFSVKGLFKDYQGDF